MNVHGGPESQSRPTFAPVTQYLASATPSSSPTCAAPPATARPTPTSTTSSSGWTPSRDLAHAAHWLRGRGHERVAVMGGSYGGFMVLAALTEYRALERRGGHRGIANLVTFLENTGSYRRGLREPEYGSLERDRQFLESISPIHKAGNIRAPLMVIHGKNDPAFP